MKLLLTIFIFIFLVFQTTLFTQNIVISEYYNLSSYPSGEWTELLIINDNTSLVGFTLRDNVGSDNIPDNWQGGVKFLDNNLWKNLRAGTIIVVHHRGSLGYDTNKEDGYIEIGAENTSFFEKRCFGCSLADWNFKALNIAQNADIIQLINTNDEHIHSLSHMVNPAGDYLLLPSPKVNHENQLSGAGSVIVVPGISLNSYGAGSDNSNTAITNNPTLGKPNNSAFSVDENQIFWRKLRHPNWNAPTLNARFFKDSVRLSWNNSIDAYPNDKTQGYIILRIQLSDMNDSHIPVDGKIYNSGDEIGNPPAKVLTIINSSQTTNYVDYLPGMCGNTFTYRIFAYRYSKDSLNQDLLPTNARGRSYNESDFGETSIKKTLAPKPEIVVENNKYSFCRGDSVVLFGKDDDKEYDYQWLFNGNNFLKNKKEIIVKESGTYELIITNSDGCSNKSEPITITVIDLPYALIYANYEQIFRDTTFTLCPNEEIELLATGGNEIKWIKDNSLYSNNNIVNVSKEGEYYAIVSNQSICVDSSYLVKIKVNDINYNLSKDTLYFYLSDSLDEQENSLRIDNLSSDTLVLFNFNIPKEFIIINPSLPIVVPPSQFIDINVKYKPQNSGKFIEIIEFECQCNKKDSIFLNCFKEAKGIFASSYNIDFPLILSCTKESSDTSIFIYNPSSEDITIFQPIINTPFSTELISTPYLLKPNEKIEIKIAIDSFKDGYYNGILLIPYNTNTNTDTLRIYINCEHYTPFYNIIYDSINFSPLKDCVEYIDTTLLITNNSKIPLYFSIKNFPEVELDFYNFDLKPNESKEINIRFKPKSEGVISFSLTITAEPCNVFKTIEIIGSKEGVIYYFDKDTINFGTLIQCQNSGQENKTLRIFAKSSSSSNSIIKSIYITGNFNHNIKENKIFKDSIEYIISFLPGPSGEYTGELTIHFDPCNIRKSVILKGKRTNPIYSISDTVINFGKNELFQKSQKAIIIKNEGEISFQIKNFENITLPFSLSINNPSLPYIIEPDSSVSFYFDYFQQIISKDSLNITFEIDEPCKISENIKLLGETFSIDSKDTIIQSFYTPNKLFLGESVSVSIILENYHNSNLSQMIIDSIVFYLQYNPSVLDLQSIIKGNCLLNHNNSSLYYNNYNKLGQTVIIIYLNKYESLGSPCNIIYLTFRGLLGNSLNTLLHIDSIYLYSNKNIEIITTDAEVQIEGNCDLEKRLIEVGAILEINTNNNEIKYQIISDEKSSLIIYDLLGNEISTIVSGCIRPGIYSSNILPSQFTKGIYFLVLKNGNIIKRKIIVL